MIYQLLHAVQRTVEHMSEISPAVPVQPRRSPQEMFPDRPGEMNNRIVPQARWLMLAFAFVATVINYLDRQTLSVLAPVLLERFRISATTYSHIIFDLLVSVGAIC